MLGLQPEDPCILNHIVRVVNTCVSSYFSVAVLEWMARAADGPWS